MAGLVLPMVGRMVGPMVYPMSPPSPPLFTGGGFSPESLFANGEAGAWYDPSDLSTLWQDAAGTIPVTADGDPVGRIDDKSGNGLHLTQSTTAAKPAYRTDGTLHWIEGDGTDDILVVLASFMNGSSMTYAASVADGTLNNGPGIGSAQSTVTNNVAGCRSSGTTDLQAYQRDEGQGLGFMTDTVSGNAGSIIASFDSADDSVQIRANGTLGTGFTGVPIANHDSLSMVGVNDSTPGFSDGKTFGAVALNRLLTPSEADALELYLANKAGVTL